MKRYNNLFDKITSLDNLETAIIKASKGKTKRKNVQKILENPLYYAMVLKQMLINKTYKASPYNESKIFDGARQKERIIYKPKFFPDQCIHWAIMLQIEPILNKRMYHWNCASIKKRGIHYAGKKIKYILQKDKKNTKYCCQIDVRKFYNSINQDILKDKLRRVFKDKDLLELLDIIIESVDSGVPIGNYTSQWFANFYLTELDNYIKHDLKVKYYIRYMDDIIIFGSNKRLLHKQLEMIREYLAEIKLSIKPNYQIYKTDSRTIDFVGFRFRRGITTIRGSLFLRMVRRFRKIYKKKVLRFKDACAVISYYGWIKYTDSRKLIRKYLEPYVNIDYCKEVIRNESNKRYTTCIS